MAARCIILTLALTCVELPLGVRVKVNRHKVGTKNQRGPTLLLKKAVALEHKDGKCSALAPVDGYQCGVIQDAESCQAARELLMDEQAQFTHGASFPEFVDYSEASSSMRDKFPGFCSIKLIGGEQGAWHIKFNGADKPETAAPVQKKSASVSFKVLCGCFEEETTTTTTVATVVSDEKVQEQIDALIRPTVPRANADSLNSGSQALTSGSKDEVDELVVAVALDHKDGKCSDMPPQGGATCGPITDADTCAAARELLMAQYEHLDHGPSFPEFADWSEKGSSMRNTIPGFCSVKVIGGDAWHVKFNGADKPETAARSSRKNAHITFKSLCGCFEHLETVQTFTEKEDLVPGTLPGKGIDPDLLTNEEKVVESIEDPLIVQEQKDPVVVEKITFTSFVTLAKGEGVCSKHVPSAGTVCAPIADVDACENARESLKEEHEKYGATFPKLEDYSQASTTLRNYAPGFCSIKLIGGEQGGWHVKFNGDDKPETSAKATKKNAHITYRILCGCYEQ